MMNRDLSLAWLLSLPVLIACGTEARTGSCGTVLSTAECEIVQAQLGVLPKDPPPDPTNSLTDPNLGQDRREAAKQLGKMLFFDTCMSSPKGTSCASCHVPEVAYVDSRRRPLRQRVQQGPTNFLYLPPIENPTLERLSIDPIKNPGVVRPQYDQDGWPLAAWNGSQWEGVIRRGQTSPSADEPAAYTGRNTPTLYNIAYGAAVPPSDGDRSYGATWVPWDGRYDSLWALAAEVFEFGGVQRTNRAHMALRIFRSSTLHTLYDASFPSATGMPNLDQSSGVPALRVYPMNASPTTSFKTGWQACWSTDSTVVKMCPEAATVALPLPATVKSDINKILTNAGKAVSVFLNSLRSNHSAYDRFVGFYDGNGQLVPGDAAALTTSQQRGLRLFIGKAACVMCHSGSNFTDWRFHNLGVPNTDPERRANGANAPVIDGGSVPPAAPAPTTCTAGAAPTPECLDTGRFAWQNRLANSCAPVTDASGAGVVRCQNASALSCAVQASQPDSDFKADVCLPAPLFDPCVISAPMGADVSTQRSLCEARPACAFVSAGQGAMALNKCVPRATERDDGAFKTPSLRNAGRTWPYMHNGVIADTSPDAQASDDPTPHLLKVVEFYNQGGGAPAVGVRDPMLRPLHLTDAEKTDLVEFLKALTDDTVGTTAVMPTDDCPS